jgi:uncharacterized membrane protein YjgN (DUF898 family)
MTESEAGSYAPQQLTFEFRATGGEYFRIWIVNLMLTIVTLGIYGPWAKVRTWRYFYGSTLLGEHPFDYHASPWRILLGRAIAFALFLGYVLTAEFYKPAVGLWGLVFIFALPWLAIASIRFAARNTSYRNVRFNFVGTYGNAFKVYILWPILGVITFGILIPRARKAQDYFFVNNHTFGGKDFNTDYSTWAIYQIYIVSFGIVIAITVLGALGMMRLLPHNAFSVAVPSSPGNPYSGMGLGFLVTIAALYLSFIFAAVYVETAIFNLNVSHMLLAGRHEFKAKLSPVSILWIYLTNALLTLITLGLYYPWAVVRLARYRRKKLTIITATNLDEFTSEAIATQGAVGEEIAGFFDLGFGL